MSHKLYEDGNNEVITKKPIENLLRPKPNTPTEPIFPTNLSEVQSTAKVHKTTSDTKRTYFTYKKSKGSTVLVLDDTEIVPNGSVILAGKKAKEKYIKQLEKLLYTKDEELDFDNMVKVLLYYNLCLNNKGPICLVSKKFPKKITTFVDALNKFYSSNEKTLNSILEMMNSKNKEEPITLEELNNV